MKDKFIFAKALIYEVGAFIKANMRKELQIEEKTRFDDLVTNLDQASQDLLMTRINQAYPNDNIMAEENNVYHSISDGNVWVLDPIDGTVNFVVQGENFAVMMAYYENGKGQFALIYDINRDQLYSGGGQFEVSVNGVPLLPYCDTPLKRSLVACNSAMFANNDYGLQTLIKQTLGVRIYGSAAISLAEVLSGRLIAYFSYLQPWDYAAGKILGESLGYVFLTLNGQEPCFNGRQKVMFVPRKKLVLIQSYLH